MNAAPILMNVWPLTLTPGPRRALGAAPRPGDPRLQRLGRAAGKALLGEHLAARLAKPHGPTQPLPACHLLLSPVPLGAPHLPPSPSRAFGGPLLLADQHTAFQQDRPGWRTRGGRPSQAPLRLWPPATEHRRAVREGRTQAPRGTASHHGLCGHAPQHGSSGPDLGGRVRWGPGGRVGPSPGGY